MRRFQPVLSHSEKIQNDTMHGKEELRLSWRLEPSHLSFSLSSWLV